MQGRQRRPSMTTTPRVMTSPPPQPPVVAGPPMALQHRATIGGAPQYFKARHPSPTAPTQAVYAMPSSMTGVRPAAGAVIPTRRSLQPPAKAGLADARKGSKSPPRVPFPGHQWAAVASCSGASTRNCSEQCPSTQPTAAPENCAPASEHCDDGSWPFQPPPPSSTRDGQRLSTMCAGDRDRGSTSVPPPVHQAPVPEEVRMAEYGRALAETQVRDNRGRGTSLNAAPTQCPAPVQRFVVADPANGAVQLVGTGSMTVPPCQRLQPQPLGRENAPLPPTQQFTIAKGPEHGSGSMMLPPQQSPAIQTIVPAVVPAPMQLAGSLTLPPAVDVTSTDCRKDYSNAGSLNLTPPQPSAVKAVPSSVPQPPPHHLPGSMTLPPCTLPQAAHVPDRRMSGGPAMLGAVVGLGSSRSASPERQGRASQQRTRPCAAPEVTGSGLMTQHHLAAPISTSRGFDTPAAAPSARALSPERMHPAAMTAFHTSPRLDSNTRSRNTSLERLHPLQGGCGSLSLPPSHLPLSHRAPSPDRAVAMQFNNSLAECRRPSPRQPATARDFAMPDVAGGAAEGSRVYIQSAAGGSCQLPPGAMPVRGSSLISFLHTRGGGGGRGPLLVPRQQMPSPMGPVLPCKSPVDRRSLSPDQTGAKGAQLLAAAARSAEAARPKASPEQPGVRTLSASARAATQSMSTIGAYTVPSRFAQAESTPAQSPPGSASGKRSLSPSMLRNAKVFDDKVGGIAQSASYTPAIGERPNCVATSLSYTPLLGDRHGGVGASASYTPVPSERPCGVATSASHTPIMFDGPSVLAASASYTPVLGERPSGVAATASYTTIMYDGPGAVAASASYTPVLGERPSGVAMSASYTPMLGERPGGVAMSACYTPVLGGSAVAQKADADSYSMAATGMTNVAVTGMLDDSFIGATRHTDGPVEDGPIGLDADTASCSNSMPGSEPTTIDADICWESSFIVDEANRTASRASAGAHGVEPGAEVGTDALDTAFVVDDSRQAIDGQPVSGRGSRREMIPELQGARAQEEQVVLSRCSSQSEPPPPELQQVVVLSKCQSGPLPGFHEASAQAAQIVQSGRNSLSEQPHDRTGPMFGTAGQNSSYDHGNSKSQVDGETCVENVHCASATAAKTSMVADVIAELERKWNAAACSRVPADQARDEGTLLGVAPSRTATQTETTAMPQGAHERAAAIAPEAAGAFGAAPPAGNAGAEVEAWNSLRSDATDCPDNVDSQAQAVAAASPESNRDQSCASDGTSITTLAPGGSPEPTDEVGPGSYVPTVDTSPHGHCEASATWDAVGLGGETQPEMAPEWTPEASPEIRSNGHERNQEFESYLREAFFTAYEAKTAAAPKEPWDAKATRAAAEFRVPETVGEDSSAVSSAAPCSTSSSVESDASGPQAVCPLALLGPRLQRSLNTKSAQDRGMAEVEEERKEEASEEAILLATQSSSEGTPSDTSASGMRWPEPRNGDPAAAARVVRDSLVQALAESAPYSSPAESQRRKLSVDVPAAPDDDVDDVDLDRRSWQPSPPSLPGLRRCSPPNSLVDTEQAFEDPRLAGPPVSTPITRMQQSESPRKTKGTPSRPRSTGSLHSLDCSDVQGGASSSPAHPLVDLDSFNRGALTARGTKRHNVQDERLSSLQECFERRLGALRELRDEIAVIRGATQVLVE